MIELTGDMFEVAGDEAFDALCITTNGFLKNDGNAVMGRGCAKQAALRWPDMHEGTAVSIVSFPVKPTRKQFGSIEERNAGCVQHMVGRWGPGDLNIPGWAVKADINLIVKSAGELVHLANTLEWDKILLPRPGCGAGELTWEDVHPRLKDILDNRFYCITFEEGS